MIRTSSLALAISVGWVLPAQAAAAQNADVSAQLAAMQAQLERLSQRVDTLEGQLDTANARAATAEQQAVAAQAEAQAARARQATASPAVTTASAPVPDFAINWKGGPEITGKGGWSFKPRGRLHIDAGTISTPGALQSSTLGGNIRVRRIRLGAEGTMPGGFGYKVEADFANGSVGFGDAFVSWTPAKTPLVIRIGNFETLDGLEQSTSSNYITFLERATFNDAFLNSRRLGLAVALLSKNSDWRVEAGIFGAHSIDSSLDNNGWIGAARVVFAPKVGTGQLHFGLGYQHREFASNISGGTSTGANMPSINQIARYRARPASQLTDLRFVDTGSFAASSDSILGFEAAAIFKKFYVTGEVQLLSSNAYSSGTLASGLDTFSGGNVAVVPTSDPSFFGAYGEIGYFFTGETRGYKRGDGTWARTKVLTPVGKGGMGAFQLALRYEYLDLADDALVAGPTNNFTTGALNLAPLNTRLGRGGMQTSYLLGLNWYPVDYIRAMINYGRVNVKGGPLASQVDPASVAPINQRDYAVNVLQTRLQFDF